ncbi:MAG: hypothetical protein ACK5LM_04450 [Lactovum sp.]
MIIYTNFFKSTIFELPTLILGIILSYINTDILQLYQARFFEKIKLKTADELEKYKLPLSVKIPFFIYSGLETILFFLVYFVDESYQVFTLVACLLTIFAYTVYQFKQLNNYLKGM